MAFYIIDEICPRMASAVKYSDRYFANLGYWTFELFFSLVNKIELEFWYCRRKQLKNLLKRMRKKRRRRPRRVMRVMKTKTPL